MKKERLLYIPALYLQATPSQIVFHTNRDGNFEIYRMKADGTALTRVTNTATGIIDQAPAWGPGQATIVFQSNRFDGQNEIYTMNTDGSNVVRLTHNTCNDTTPAWSSFTGQIAWTSNCGGSDNEIWTMDYNGNNKQQRTNNTSSDTRPKWAPITNQIAYVANGMITIMNGDGTNPVALTAGSDPDWSPNGQQMLFSCNLSGEREICMVPIGGGDVTQITNQTDSIDFSPVWAPNGQSLAFVSNVNEETVYDVYTTTAVYNALVFRVPSLAALPAGSDEGSPDW